MRKIARVSLAALAVLSLGLATPSLAQPAPRPVPEGPAGRILGCLRVVNLTEAQKDAIKAVFETARPAVAAAAQDVKAAGEELKTLMQATNKDACAIGNALIALQTAREGLRTELEKVRTGVEAVLTPEQKAMLAGCLAAPHGGPGNIAFEGEPEF
ncbi:MAG: periplasmic heavy metal sensor [Acidobacteria bacterium]|nr:periplasmic heavy metal sensor [Acidobacteriota bacterium]MCK6682940.1 periplasmic heavy metal sensor [Thermoanaerobaculia bacterium]